jgi:hypothetical protein
MRASPTKATTVTSRTGRTTPRSLGCEVCNFRGNTYNKDSTLHEADMNS